jgi:hypothetical protein
MHLQLPRVRCDQTPLRYNLGLELKLCPDTWPDSKEASLELSLIHTKKLCWLSHESYNPTACILSWKTLCNTQRISNAEHPYMYKRLMLPSLSLSMWVSSYEWEENIAANKQQQKVWWVGITVPTFISKKVRMPQGSPTFWCILSFYLSIDAAAFPELFQFTASVFSEAAISKCPSRAVPCKSGSNCKYSDDDSSNNLLLNFQGALCQLSNKHNHKYISTWTHGLFTESSTHTSQSSFLYHINKKKNVYTTYQPLSYRIHYSHISNVN